MGLGCLPIFGGQFGRQIDGQLSEKHVKTIQKPSLKPPPNTRKLQINQSDLMLIHDPSPKHSGGQTRDKIKKNAHQQMLVDF